MENIIKSTWAKRISPVLASILLLSFFTIPANAATSITIPVPVNTNTSSLTTLFSNTDPNFIGGFGDSTPVLVIASVTTGTLQLATTTGLTAVTGYQSPVGNSRALEIAFTGTQSDANTALKTLKYMGDSARTGAATLTITSAVSGGAYNTTNGHYYEFKNLSLAWDISRCVAKYVYTTSGSATEIVNTTTLNNETIFTKSTCEAKAGYAKTIRTFNGLAGYLATATTAAENTFITDKAGTAAGWLGGTDQASDQVWKWIDGPEAGQTFWTTGLTRRTTHTIDGYSQFNNWNDGEPNGTGGYEDALQILSGGTGAWNDLTHNSSSTSLPFIIEYGSTIESATTAPAEANRTLTIISAPIAPTISSITAGNTQLTVNFSAPADLGGSAISDYEYSTNNGSTWTTSGTTTSPITITGLTNATTYQIKLRAINTTGTGTASAATSGTPVATVPSAPTITSITPGTGQLSVAFTAPTSSGTSAINDYEYSTNNGSTWTSSGSIISPITITGLTNATTYQVKLRAKNTSGSGNSSAATSATTNAVASGGDSTPTTLTPTPTPTPTTKAKPKPKNIVIDNPVTPDPTANPAPLGPVTINKPTPLLERIIADLSEFLRPVITDVFVTPSPNPSLPIFTDEDALKLITNAGDKKIGNAPSLVLFNNQYQPSKLALLDNESAQVVTVTGGVLNIEARENDKQIALNPQGRVELVQSNSINARGSGLAPNTEFAVYIFSEPTLLGIGKTNAKGEFFVSFAVKKKIPLGDHTLQVNGLLADGRTSSVSMPVSLIENTGNVLVSENPVTRATNALYFFIAIFAILILILLFGGSRLILAAIRRRNEEEN